MKKRCIGRIHVSSEPYLIYFLLESTSRNIRGKVINRISAASSNYSLKELENAIVIFSEIDIKLKTKKVIDEAEFTNIINGVFKSEG